MIIGANHLQVQMLTEIAANQWAEVFTAIGFSGLAISIFLLLRRGRR